MTGTERLRALCRREPVDRPAWSILIDQASLSGLPADLRGRYGLDFHAHLGCDAFLLDGWNTPITFSSPRFEWGPGVSERVYPDGDRWIREWSSPYGTLQAVSRENHPLRYPVTTREEVRIFSRMWEGARYLPADDAPAHRQLLDLLGTQGVYTRYWGSSAVQRLLQQDTGLEAFYSLLDDAPAEMTGLIETLHARQLEAFRLLAESATETITLCENTSTYLISPDIYQRFNMPHVRDFVRIMHEHGKTALIHMCGHVRHLLTLIRETGLDGIHALTPPQTGDTPWELALDILGDELIIIGALPPDLWLAGPPEHIADALRAFYTPRLRKSHFVLCLFADGIAVPQARFEAVARWMANES